MRQRESHGRGQHREGRASGEIESGVAACGRTVASPSRSDCTCQGVNCVRIACLYLYTRARIQMRLYIPSAHLYIPCVRLYTPQTRLSRGFSQRALRLTSTRLAVRTTRPGRARTCIPDERESAFDDPNQLWNPHRPLADILRREPLPRPLEHLHLPCVHRQHRTLIRVQLRQRHRAHVRARVE